MLNRVTVVDPGTEVSDFGNSRGTDLMSIHGDCTEFNRQLTIMSDRDGDAIAVIHDYDGGWEVLYTKEH